MALTHEDISKMTNIADVVENIWGIRVATLFEDWNSEKTEVQERVLPKEIRERIEVDDVEIQLFYTKEHYFYIANKEVIFGERIIDNDPALSAVVDFNDKEEYMLLMIYTGLKRRDLVERLMAEPQVMSYFFMHV